MQGTWLYQESLLLGQTYGLWSPRLSRRQGHEHGVVRQGHEELVGVYLCTVLLAHQSQRHCRQGQQQSLAHLRHRFNLHLFNVKQRETTNSTCIKWNNKTFKDLRMQFSTAIRRRKIQRYGNRTYDHLSSMWIYCQLHHVYLRFHLVKVFADIDTRPFSWFG